MPIVFEFPTPQLAQLFYDALGDHSMSMTGRSVKVHDGDPFVAKDLAARYGAREVTHLR